MHDFPIFKRGFWRHLGTCGAANSHPRARPHELQQTVRCFEKGPLTWRRCILLLSYRDGSLANQEIDGHDIAWCFLFPHVLFDKYWVIEGFLSFSINLKSDLHEADHSKANLNLGAFEARPGPRNTG